MLPDGKFTQFYSTEITPELYAREIAPARTFVREEDVQPLMDKGLIKGGSLENAVVIREDSVLSKEPLRFEEEFARHKILDIVGDLMLCGKRIMGHVIAVRPGHGPNTEMAAILSKEYKRMRSMVPGVAIPRGEAVMDVNEVMRVLPHRYPLSHARPYCQLPRRKQMHRGQVGHYQRTVLPRSLPRPPGHARSSPA